MKAAEQDRAEVAFRTAAADNVATLTEAFRRAVLALLVRRELMEAETALVVPDPGRAIGSRPLIRPPGEAGSSWWTATSGSLDCPLTWLYFGRAD